MIAGKQTYALKLSSTPSAGGLHRVQGVHVMPGQWAGSDRKAELPRNWDIIRAEILLRDHHMCQWVDRGVKCLAYANEVDHIRDPHDHNPHNLRALCSPHHARKSSAEGNDARRRLMAKLQLPKRPHPGLIAEG